MRAHVSARRNAYGCDIVLRTENDRVRLIESPYRLPFRDAMFDFVGSNQVLEHVRDYDSAFHEIHRVLKSGGVSLHFFPAQLVLIEPHSLVPLATIIQHRHWLGLWARLGIRNQFQEGMAASEVVNMNRRYLRANTNYLRRKEIQSIVKAIFSEWRFVELEAMQVGSDRLRKVGHVARYLRFLSILYSTFRARVLFLGKSLDTGG
jgi:SAM-dependent methyltransferase